MDSQAQLEEGKQSPNTNLGDKPVGDKTTSEELEKKKKAVEDAEKKLNEREILFMRNQLIALGYPKAKADKKNNKETLQELIDEYTEKRNEASKEQKDEETDEKKTNSGNIKVNAGIPSVQMPSGETVEGDIQTERTNKVADIGFIVDPTKAPKLVNKIRSNARINYLPPDTEHPYRRIVA
jgi:hypothetical protein